MKILTPPKWAPNAVATEQGWVDPKTGELLISLRGLKSKIEKEKPSIILEIESSMECSTDTTFVEITTEKPTEVINIEPTSEGTAVTLEPVSKETEEIKVVPEKKGRGRPKKQQNG